jgi:hypothetical protein
MMELQPIDFKSAKAFVDDFHRHNVGSKGHKFSIGLQENGELIGVCMVGRPIARFMDDKWTLEVLRVCVLDGHKNANSKLYGAAWNVAKNLGYRRLITYTLTTESGSSLRGAGWKIVAEVKPHKDGWNMPGRAREMPLRYPKGDKYRWEINDDGNIHTKERE